MKRITIIGGGASGTLLAANLIKHAGREPLEINLIEKNSQFGRGIAYGTAKDFHLLNVPAAKMSAFSNDPEHFYQWLQGNNLDFAHGDFVPRKIYGNYLRAVLQTATENKSANVNFNILNDEAIDVSGEKDETMVLLKNGNAILSDKIVLAFGNFLPAHVRAENNDYIKSSRYFANPWSEAIPSQINRDERVLLIGTGLTGIDVILSLYHNEHRGNIFALSTHGLFPTVHQKAEPYQSFQTEAEVDRTIRGLFKIVRKHIRNAEANGGDWRAVIDSLRPFTQSLWYNLPLAEKRRFLRHLQRRWDVARHRMPFECSSILEELKAKEQLQVLRGRIRQIESLSENGFTIVFGRGDQVSVDRIINCTGSQSNYAKLDAPLVKNLLAKGEIKPDALFLGLDATPNGNIINQKGEASNIFFTFATAQKGVLWECTAMPDIRVQAENLALRLLN